MASRTGTFDTEPTNTADEIGCAAENVEQGVSNTASSVKQKASELGRQAAGEVEAKRAAAADALESAAATVHEKAERLPGGETVRSAAHSAAEKLESTAGYIRRRDMSGMLSDLKGIVRRNPGPSLLLVAAVGFLIGRAFRED